MWADNETDIDLLGFDFLVDELLALLTEPSIFPVTIGVTGDWGSGKSSVLMMTAAKLEADAGKFIVVRFSPWQFEGYEDVKTALMATVMESLQAAVDADRTAVERSKELLARLLRRVRWLAAARLVAKVALAAHAGVPPDVTELVSGDLIKKEGKEEDPISSVSEFRQDFAELLAGLEQIQALVVFVDDLDRCLPPTIIETFEAIQLFLHVPKAAYVIAADERIVKGAIEHRYPEATREAPGLRQDYLEKLLQMKLVLPPLAAPEAESYINLLLAQANSSNDEFEKLREAAVEQRKARYIGVSMNHAIAKATLGEVPESLTAAFQVASQCAPILARQLRGNPRQIKRFLNTLTLRRRAAERRGVVLEFAVLAKLMVLEEVDLSSFERLFRWQAAQDGRPIEIDQAEAFAIDGTIPAADGEGEVAKWAAGAQVTEWLRLDPRLAGVNLAPYFFFSRERLAISVPASRLTPDQQRLLADLDGPLAATRSRAVAETLGAAVEDRVAIYSVLLERVVRKPESPGTASAIELAAREPSLLGDLAAALDRIPTAALPSNLAMTLPIHFRPLPPELDRLVKRWATQGTGLARAGAVRAQRGRGGG